MQDLPTARLVPQALVKLIDLGIARVLKRDQRLTSAGLFLGKPRYASPEQERESVGELGELLDAHDLFDRPASTFAPTCLSMWDFRLRFPPV